jgi:hypothetical protein
MTVDWIVLVVRLPTEPSRHRVSVWRELRRAGALPLAAGTWAFPATPLATEVVNRVGDLVRRAPDGEILLLDASGRDSESQAKLAAQYTDEREAEWTEFLADCAKFDAEIEREIAKEKFTLAELEEEEQSLDRLRRWQRDVALRDTFGAPSSGLAELALKESTDRLEQFSELVYQALGQ